ncbi:helix-turn-helix domain-containing protein [Streptomyces lincolnensis]|uniref:helix-turn-helix domain-containing protein n=1 Tax=Streptomyces lincolnensis TaxID=1915 RepID=UPI0037CF060A
MPRRPKRKPPPPRGCLWIEEAADRVGVTVATLRNWRHLGKGPMSFMIARRIVYRITDLDAFVEGLYQAALNPPPNPDMRPPEPRLSRRPRRAG